MTAHRIAYKFHATFSLFPTRLGGRKKPVYNHYRPSFTFNTEQHFSGEVMFPETGELQPGETATATVKLLPSRNIRKNLKVGDAFTINEGDTPIGSGVITAIEHEVFAD